MSERTDRQNRIEKLAKNFRDFKKEWDNFLENDWRRLVLGVETLKADIGTLHSDTMTLVKQSNSMLEGLVVMEKNILKAIKGVESKVRRG